jgi:large subunit ribosomal protein L46
MLKTYCRIIKVFFFKSHIFAGQVKLDPTEYTDFLWLSKEEMEHKVPREYWESIRDMISEI